MTPDPTERRYPTFDAFAQRIPLVGILGLRELDERDGCVRLALEPRPDLLQVARVVHGGVLSTLADTTGVWSILRDLPAERTITSIEFKLNFLRPARADGGEIVARARVLHLGARVAVVDVELEQARRAVARGLFTYLVLDASEARVD